MARRKKSALDEILESTGRNISSIFSNVSRAISPAINTAQNFFGDFSRGFQQFQRQKIEQDAQRQRQVFDFTKNLISTGVKAGGDFIKERQSFGDRVRNQTRINQRQGFNTALDFSRNFLPTQIPDNIQRLSLGLERAKQVIPLTLGAFSTSLAENLTNPKTLMGMKIEPLMKRDTYIKELEFIPKFFKEQGDTLIGQGLDEKKRLDIEETKLSPAETIWEEIWNGALSNVPTFITAIGAGLIASRFGGPKFGQMVSTMVFAPFNFGDVMADALEHGMSNEDASRLAVSTGSIITAIDRIGLTKMFKTLPGGIGNVDKLVRKLLTGLGSGVLEGTTEAVQGFVQDTVALFNYDELRDPLDLRKRFIEGAIGFLMSAPAAVITSTTPEEAQPQVSSQPGRVLDASGQPISPPIQPKVAPAPADFRTDKPEGLVGVKQTVTSTDKKAQDILSEIEKPKDGPQGKILTLEEMKILSDYLKTSTPDELRGTVYKPFGGGVDIVFGVIRDRQNEGQVEYLVMNKEGSTNGRFKLHSTPIKQSEIIDKIDLDNGEVMKELAEGKILKAPAPETPADLINEDLKKALTTDAKGTSQDPVSTRPIGSKDFDISVKEARGILLGFFSPEEVAFITAGLKDIITPEGKYARGKFYDSLITVVEQNGKVQSKTLYHEALHAYIAKFADKKLADAAVKQIMREQGISKKEALEKLPDGFADFVAQRETFSGEIRALFQELLNSIKRLMGKENSAQLLYTATIYGDRSSQQAQDTAARQSQDVTPEQQKENDEALDELIDEAKFRVQDEKGGVLDKTKKSMDKADLDRRKARDARNGPWFRRFKSSAIDRLSPVFHFMELSGKDISAEESAYKALRLLGGISGVSEAFIRRNIQPILKDNKHTLKDLDALVNFQRERELVVDRNLKRQHTAESIEEGLQELREKYSPEEFAKLEESADKLRDVGAMFLAMLHDSGIIDDVQYAKIKENNQFYVPMEAAEHVADNIEKGRTGTGGSYNVATQDIINTIGDYEGAVGSPIDALLRMTHKTISLVQKNEAMKLLVGMRERFPDIYNDIIQPLRTAENVKRRIELYTELKELKKVQNKSERLIKTRSKWAKKLVSELNILNKRGLNLRLIDKGSNVSEQAIIDAILKDDSAGNVKTLVEFLVNGDPKGLKQIRRQIGTRENKLGPILDELIEIREELDIVKAERLTRLDEVEQKKDLKRDGLAVINLFRDGVVEAYAVPEDVEVAVKNLDIETAGVISKVGKISANILRMGATGLNIAFLPVNVVRDIQDAITTETTEKGAGAALRMMISYPAAVMSALGKGELYLQWAEAGGLQSSLVEQLIGETRKTKEELAGRKSVFKHVITSPKDFVSFANRVGEQSTRLARFKSGMARGESAQEAAFKSRDISIDFSKAGNTIKTLNQFIPFLNAQFQGTEKNIRLWRRNPKRAAATFLFTRVAPAVMLFLHNSQFDDFDDIPDWEKENHWIFILRDRTREEVVAGEKLIGWKFPKPFTGREVATMTESVMEFSRKKDPNIFKDAAIASIGTLSPVGLPINERELGQSLSGLGFTPVQAAVEAVTNTKLFTGGPIVPQSLKRFGDPRMEFRPNTPKSYVWIGQRLNISPLIIENTTQRITGGLGQQVALFFSGDPIAAGPGSIAARFWGVRGGDKANVARALKKEQDAIDARLNEAIRTAASSGNQAELDRLTVNIKSKDVKTILRTTETREERAQRTPLENIYDSFTTRQIERLQSEGSGLGFSDKVSIVGGVSGQELNFPYSIAIKADKYEIDWDKLEGGTGIAKHAQAEKKLKEARTLHDEKTWTQEEKDVAYKRLGTDRKEVRYDALAHFTEDVSVDYLVEKFTDADADYIMESILTGRTVSSSGEQFVSNGVLEDLKNLGYITNGEYKAIKKMRFDKDGNLIETVGSGGSGGAGKKVNLSLRSVKTTAPKFSTKTIRRGIGTGVTTKIPTLPGIRLKAPVTKAAQEQFQRLRILPEIKAPVTRLSGLGRI